MKSNYKLTILSSKEFDKLPKSITRGSDISMSLGFADPRRGTAYVRHTAWPELTSYLIDHELEHLVEEHASDEDMNGIRHKNIGQVFRSIINPLNFGGLGPISNESKGFLNTSKEGSFNKIAGPLSSAAGNAASGFAFGGPGGAGLGALKGLTSYNSQKPGSFQGDNFSNMFGGSIPQQNQASLGQGFGQSGSYSPSGVGPSGGQGTPMANMGLSAGLPNNSNISMGQQGNQDQQRQSGFWFPQFKF